ncbi:MAG: hypothetical protein ACK58L_12075, partial [Planctomycetota bacterium]
GQGSRWDQSLCRVFGLLPVFPVSRNELVNCCNYGIVLVMIAVSVRKRSADFTPCRDIEF